MDDRTAYREGDWVFLLLQAVFCEVFGSSRVYQNVMLPFAATKHNVVFAGSFGSGEV